MNHELKSVGRIRHLGGKNGWFRATCTCGTTATEAVAARAIKRIRDHIKSKSA